MNTLTTTDEPHQAHRPTQPKEETKMTTHKTQDTTEHWQCTTTTTTMTTTFCATHKFMLMEWSGFSHFSVAIKRLKKKLERTYQGTATSTTPTMKTVTMQDERGCFFLLIFFSFLFGICSVVGRQRGHLNVHRDFNNFMIAEQNEKRSKNDGVRGEKRLRMIFFWHPKTRSSKMN